MDARLPAARALFALGEVARSMGEPTPALDHYAAGEELTKVSGDPDLGWRIAFGQAQALETLGRRDEALTAYRKAVAIIEAVRTRLREERFRAGYIQDKYQVYVALVRLLLSLEQADEAFSFAERLRSRRHLELLDQAPRKAESPSEDALKGRIRRLQRAIEEESAKPAAERRAAALDLFSGELAAAEREYQGLLDDLRTRRPEHARARALAVPTSDQIRQDLPAQTALIEYVVGDEEVAIFVLTRQGMGAVTVPQRHADLRTRVELLRDLIVREGTSDWLKPAESLRRTLLEPIEKGGWLQGIRRLYLVPHGVLHYVPFAALPRRDRNGVRYLVEDYEVAHLPAAATLVHSRREAGAARTLFGLAPARARLPYAKQEVHGVAEFFRQPQLLLVGRGATESAFKRRAPDYRVVHLATHGYFNKLNPLFSGLELEPGEADNGRLEVHEILGLRLDADLVTLSACETALGGGHVAEVPAGDDIVGLTRAFLAAGSRSVLATLWEVNDRSTLRLMRRFYRDRARVGTAASLAAAQRELCHGSDRYRHPYFWAPFVLVGDMS
jgi:CHAT domain-containing protein